MIESKPGKYSIVSVMVLLAVLVAFRAPERKRPFLYPLAVGVIAWAGYIGLRTKTWSPPPPSSILGDVGSFIEAVPALVASFCRWAGEGGPVPLPPQAMAEWIWDHREEIGADWPSIVRPVVAAYGESVRSTHPNLVWANRGGDAVLEVPGRPWTRRRVALEVHENVFSDV